MTYSLGHQCNAYLKEVRVSKRLGERDIKRREELKVGPERGLGIYSPTNREWGSEGDCAEGGRKREKAWKRRERCKRQEV